MVKKLYKHEALYYLRWVAPLVGGCLGIALISKLTLLFGDNIIGMMIRQLMTSLYMTALGAAITLGFIIVALRFFRSMFTHEGYFTHTIPVESSTLINCKLICGLCFMIVIVITVCVSAVIMSAGTIDGNILQLATEGIVRSVSDGYGIDVVLFSVEIPLVVLAVLLASILRAYAACAIGQRMKSKIGGAIMWFFILYGIKQAANAVLVAVFLPVLVSMQNITSLHILTGIYTLYEISIAVTFYIITRVRIKKKLNLE